MPLNKSTQYSIFCENYIECDGFTDFETLPYRLPNGLLVKSPQQYYKSKGWLIVKGKCYCPKCKAKMVTIRNK